jgi:DNA-binding NarL/FixJ family response regulator
MVAVWIMTASPSRRDRLLRAFDHAESIRVAGTAATFPFLRSLMDETPGDIVLIELQTEDNVNREWLFDILDRMPAIILAADHDSAVFNQILRSGSGGILRADASTEQIVQAVHSVASGLMVFDSVAVPHVDDDPLIEPLTPRENEVLQLLADGLGNKEIAFRLGISEHTIKFHIRSILGKLGASTRTEAVSRGLRSGLIEL